MSHKSIMTKNNGMLSSLSRDLRVSVDSLDSGQDMISVSQPSVKYCHCTNNCCLTCCSYQEAGFKEAKNVQELVEAIPRLGGYVHCIRPFSYELWSLVCCLTDCQYLWGVSKTEEKQLQLLKKVVDGFLQKQVARASEGRHPLTYQVCYITESGSHLMPNLLQDIMSNIKELVSGEGLPDFQLRQGNVWANVKPTPVSSVTTASSPASSLDSTSGKKKKKPNTKDKSTSGNPAAGVCFSWNNSGSCNCGGRWKHICSALVSINKICGQSDHGARQHQY